MSSKSPSPKIALITGANSGLGKATAIELARQGHFLLLLGRDSEKSRRALDEIKQESGSESVEWICADLASLHSLDQAIAQIQVNYPHLDLLINNAGVYKRRDERSVDGLEMSLAVNYLAPFYLTQRLLPLLRQSGSARIINLSSNLHRFGKLAPNELDTNLRYNYRAYANSKFLLQAFTYALAERLRGTGVTVNCLHPGRIGSEMLREYPRWIQRLMKYVQEEPSQGAQHVLYLATAPELFHISGQYFCKQCPKDGSEASRDPELQDQFWQATERLLQTCYSKGKSRSQTQSLRTKSRTSPIKSSPLN